jgi:hypothetical protein
VGGVVTVVVVVGVVDFVVVSEECVLIVLSGNGGTDAFNLLRIEFTEDWR